MKLSHSFASRVRKLLHAELHLGPLRCRAIRARNNKSNLHLRKKDGRTEGLFRNRLRLQAASWQCSRLKPLKSLAKTILHCNTAGLSFQPLYKARKRLRCRGTVVKPYTNRGAYVFSLMGTERTLLACTGTYSQSVATVLT